MMGFPRYRNPELERSIQRDPNNAQLWSSYARWLTEHGDPRGEAIRSGLELASAGYASKRYREREFAIASATDIGLVPEQFRHHDYDEWDKERVLLDGIDLVFRHTFLHEVEVSAEFMASYPRRLFRDPQSEPYRALVHLLGRAPFLFSLACDLEVPLHSESLHELRMFAPSFGMPAEDVVVPNLRRLCIASCIVLTDFADLLARLPLLESLEVDNGVALTSRRALNHPGLRRLSFRHDGPLGSEVSLFECAQFESLTDFTLESLRDDAVAVLNRMLAAPSFCRLRALKVRLGEIGACSDLSCRNLDRLEALTVSTWRSLDDSAFVPLDTLPCLRALTIQARRVDALPPSFGHARISELNLDFSSLDDDAAPRLVGARFPRLRSLRGRRELPLEYLLEGPSYHQLTEFCVLGALDESLLLALSKCPARNSLECLKMSSLDTKDAERLLTKRHLFPNLREVHISKASYRLVEALREETVGLSSAFERLVVEPSRSLWGDNGLSFIVGSTDAHRIPFP